MEAGCSNLSDVASLIVTAVSLIILSIITLSTAVHFQRNSKYPEVKNLIIIILLVPNLIGWTAWVEMLLGKRVRSMEFLINLFKAIITACFLLYIERILGWVQYDDRNSYSEDRKHHVLLNATTHRYLCRQAHPVKSIEQAKSFLFRIRITVFQLCTLLVILGIIGLTMVIATGNYELTDPTQNSIIEYFSIAQILSAIIALIGFGKIIVYASKIPEMQRFDLLSKFIVIELAMFFTEIQPLIILAFANNGLIASSSQNSSTSIASYTTSLLLVSEMNIMSALLLKVFPLADYEKHPGKFTQEVDTFRTVFSKENKISEEEEEEETPRIIERNDSEYCYSLINELCGKIEDLQRQMIGRESPEEERQALFEGFKDIKEMVESFRKENIDEEKAVWEMERDNLMQIINDLQEELDHNRLIISKQEIIDKLKHDLERNVNTYARNEVTNINLTDKSNEMSVRLTRMEKELYAPRECKHNINFASTEVIHLNQVIAAKQEKIEKYKENIKSVNDTMQQRERKIEEFEKIIRTSDYQIKVLNEQINDLKKYLHEKETHMKQEREEQRQKLNHTEEELNLILTENQALTKKLYLTSKSVQSTKEEEFYNLMLGPENLESEKLLHKSETLTKIISKIKGECGEDEEAENRRMKKNENDYWCSLINELCLKIEDLQRQLMEKESSDKIHMFEGLKDAKERSENLKKENIDEEKAKWETERADLKQIINNLQEELEQNRLILLKQKNIDILKPDLEIDQEEYAKNEIVTKTLTEKLNGMSEQLASVEKALYESQECKHNLDIASAEIIHLQNAIVDKQDEIDGYQKNLNYLKEALLEKKNTIESFDKAIRTSDYQIKIFNEQVYELKKSLSDKEIHMIQEKEVQKKTIKALEEELALILSENQDLKKELHLAKTSAQSIKEEEFSKSRLETENFESKISSLTSLLKKQRDQHSNLESQLQASELRTKEISAKQQFYQETIENCRAVITELRTKQESHESLTKDYQNSLSSIEQLNAMTYSLKSEIHSLKDTIHSLESFKSDNEFYKNLYQSTLQDLERKNKSKIDLELLLKSNLNQEKNSLSLQISKLAQALDAADAQTSEYRIQMSHQQQEFDKERDELLINFFNHKKRISQLERKLKTQEEFMENELESSQRELYSFSDQVKNLNIQNESYKQEIERLASLNAVLKQQLSAKELEICDLSQDRNIQVNFIQEKIIYENQIEEIQKNLKNTLERLKELVSEKECLREELSTKHAELQSLSEEFITFQSQVFETEKTTPFATSELSERLHSISMNEPSLSNSIKSPQDLIILESISPNTINFLLDNVSKLRKETPMAYKSVWKLFEAIMIDKCKMDRIELSMSRYPRTMTEYMLDFVYIHYGLKTLALKQLKALTISLELLYKQNHPYGILFCRFLGLFHPRPLPDRISIYLLMVQERFMELTSHVKHWPNSLLQNYEIIQNGGQASIIDVMELVRRICGNNRDVGERIITAIHKNPINRIEFTLLKICGCIARMGKTSEFILEILNAEKTKNQDFIDGIRDTLDLWLTKEELEDLCLHIDNENTGFITIKSWHSKVNFADFADMMYSTTAMINKSDFLNSLVDEYEYEVVQDYYRLKQMIKCPVTNQVMMANVLLEIDHNLEQEDLVSLYEEAMEEDGRVGGVSPNAICAVVLKHNIGGYGVGVFDFYSIENRLDYISNEEIRTEMWKGYRRIE